ncbi:MAG TPA: hypothetical protein VK753_04165, partial [Xanthomonadaceae bacterium]|nr:hypothetical protein [Xanthomonadaceae bacterium]
RIAHIGIARIANVLADVPADRTSWLSDSESVRFADMRNDNRKAQYLAGHWLTRVLLARALGGEAARWRLSERKSLPPQVEGHPESVAVSISHTRHWIAAAVANVAIGIDLEQRPRILDAGLEPLLRNADEAEGSLDADTMLQRWVAKEAWIKRNSGSAVPAQLRQLHLQVAVREHADVRIDSCPAFHFGVAVASNCVVRLDSAERLVPGVGFAVTEIEAQEA